MPENIQRITIKNEPSEHRRYSKSRKRDTSGCSQLQKEFIARVEDYKTALRLTNKDICKDTGITEASLSHYLNGTRLPGCETLVKLADFFGCTTDYLLGREGL